MPDPYSHVTSVDASVLQRLIDAMELRAADPRTRGIREAVLSWMDFPRDARVLEIGCGSGAVCRELARWPNVNEVIGLDPSPVFLAKARDLAADIINLRFDEGDARALPYASGQFDAVLFHTCLTHVPNPQQALIEACRVLHAGGRLGILDGDYSTTSVATGDHDPLQACIDAAVAGLVHDRWLVRRLPGLVTSAGFHIERFDSHAYLQTSAPDYMLTLVDRGADLLMHSGTIDRTMADALKSEARRRAVHGEFFGFIAFASVIASKPNSASSTD